MNMILGIYDHNVFLFTVVELYAFYAATGDKKLVQQLLDENSDRITLVDASGLLFLHRNMS